MSLSKDQQRDFFDLGFPLPQWSVVPLMSVKEPIKDFILTTPKQPVPIPLA
jgi:hypothetical protein